MMEKKSRQGGGGKVEKRYTDQDIIDMLWACGGMIRETCRRLNIDPNQFYAHYRNKENIEAELQKIWRCGAQNVVDTIYERATSGDMKAANLYMKYNPYTKEMGWVPEESKVTIKTEKPLTDEEKHALKDELFG